jgi:hypothetical protein
MISSLIVGPWCVDEVDSELDGSPNYLAGGLSIRRLTPDAGTGDPHRTEAKPVHWSKVGNVECSAVGDRKSHGVDNCDRVARIPGCSQAASATGSGAAWTITSEVTARVRQT